ncbi:MAG: hypothetical protein ABSA83_04600 [Verrucomicrobiota bacterium]|jgi:hypothetical protein
MPELREIANDKIRENSPFRGEMLSLIAGGEAIAFVGAGLSIPLQYPSWLQLLQILNAAANKSESFNPFNDLGADPLRIAEEIRSMFVKHGRLAEYKSILGNQFSPKPNDNFTETHRRLVRLPFRGFVTSNRH